MLCMGVTYARVGRLLWGSQRIGERSEAQSDSLKAKRKASDGRGRVTFLIFFCGVLRYHEKADEMGTDQVWLKNEKLFSLLL